MAKPLSKDDRGVTKEHNAGARKEAIKNALQEMRTHDLAIAAALDKYVEPYRAMKRDIKKRLRDDFNITAKQFNARYNLFKLEADAQAAQDDITLDVIREFYEVAPVGGVVDLVTAAEEAAKREKP